MSHFLLLPLEKARKRFRFKLNPRPNQITEPAPWYCAWRVDVFAFQKQFFTLLVNPSTLYSGIVPAGSYRDILTRISQKVFQMISDHNPDFKGGLPDQFVFDKTNDRSLLGSINDMFRMAKYPDLARFDTDVWLPETERLLNETPFGMLQMKNPQSLFGSQITFLKTGPGRAHNSQ